MPKDRAHNLNEKPRTEDVIIEDDIHFKDLLLSDATLKGLEATGFRKPSPIQRKAIPLGRCGFDLIVQAKSGTGKTCVFTIVALEMVKPEVDRLQVLIMSPTREISVQIKDVISAIGQGLRNLNVQVFIGGLPMESDKKNLQKCQIAVGAPGRVKHLMTAGLMKVDAVRLFVLDEADKLMEESFRSDIGFIYLALPEVKQVIATSATFPPKLNEFVARYMSSPMRVSLERGIFLKGIRQFVTVVPAHINVLNQMNNKINELIRILSNISFKQCLVFSNYQSRAESLCSQLTKQGWPAMHINGTQNQTTRLKMMEGLKEFRCRVFISTDLTSRGIDAENVNLVVNMDLPYDGATYMHRIGRSGRYGSHGIAVTIVQNGSECTQFKKMLNDIGGKDFEVSILPTGKLDLDIWKMKEKTFEKMSALEGEYRGLIKKESSGRGLDAESGNGGEKKDEDQQEGEKLHNGAAVKTSERADFTLLENVLESLRSDRKWTKKERIKSFEELVSLANEFKYGADWSKGLTPLKNEFNMKKYSSDFLSAVGSVEEASWKKFKEKLIQKPGENGEVPVTVRQQEPLPKPSEQLCHRDQVKRDTANKKEEEDEEEKDDEEKEEEEENICDRTQDNKSETDVGERRNRRGEDESECEEENDEGEEQVVFAADRSYSKTFYRNWYGTWYAQLSTVRQYVNFVKAFNHNQVEVPNW